MIPYRRAGLVLVWIPLIAWAGCGGFNAGGDIRVPLEQQHVLTAAPAQANALRLPEDHPYNIHIKKSSQNPGPDGQADSGAEALAAGEASCSAQSQKDGSAEAEFCLGHRISNQGEAAQSAAIELQYDLAQTVKAPPVPKPRTLAGADLQLLVLDSQKRKVVGLILSQTGSDEAAATAAVKDHRSLTVTMEPRMTYDVFLVGKVNASSAGGDQAEAKLEIKNLKMVLTFTPVQSKPAD